MGAKNENGVKMTVVWWFQTLFPEIYLSFPFPFAIRSENSYNQTPLCEKVDPL